MKGAKFASKPVRRDLTVTLPRPSQNGNNVNFDTVLFAVHPPFPWINLLRTAEQMGRHLFARENTLMLNMRCLIGKNDFRWRIRELGANGLGQSNANFTYLEETLQADNSAKFVDWLAVSAAANKPLPQNIARRMIVSNSTLFRKKAIYSFMGNANADIAYYPASHVQDQLCEMVRQAPLYKGSSRLATAAGAFAHLLAIHPFEDGNGRAARRLFQVMLKQFGLWCDLYLPLGPLAHLDRKNYIQALRGLFINGEFEKFLDYVSLWATAASELALINHEKHSHFA